MAITSESWNEITNTAGFTVNGSVAAAPQSALPTLPLGSVVASTSSNNTYYVRFRLPTGSSAPVDGSTLYQLSSFATSADSEASHTSFGALTLGFRHDELTPQLFQTLASGSLFAEVDVLGYANGTLTQDYSFGLAQASELTAGSAGNTSLSLDYTSEEVQIGTQPAAAWNALNSTATFLTNGSTASTPDSAPATLPADGVAVAGATGGALTYYVRFTLPAGPSGSFDGQTLFQLGSFSSGAANVVALGTGAGAAKAQFQPFQLSFTQSQLTPQLLQMLKGASSFAEVDVLAYDQSGALAQDYSFGSVAS